MFSKACEYGIRATIYITKKSLDGIRVTIGDISEEIDSPSAFTAKILQKLVKGRIIDSVRGPRGGFYIATETSKKIKLSDIVQVIDGDAVYNRCGLGLKECSSLNPCPLHDKFVTIREDLRILLEQTSITELALQLEAGTAVLKI